LGDTREGSLRRESPSRDTSGREAPQAMTARPTTPPQGSAQEPAALGLWRGWSEGMGGDDQNCFNLQTPISYSRKPRFLSLKFFLGINTIQILFAVKKIDLPFCNMHSWKRTCTLDWFNKQSMVHLAVV